MSSYTLGKYMHLGSADSKFCMFILRGFNFRKHQTSVLAKARDPTLSHQSFPSMDEQQRCSITHCSTYQHFNVCFPALSLLLAPFFKWRSPIVNLAFALIHYHHIVRDGKSWVMLFWGWKNEKHCQIQFPQLCHPAAVRWGEWYRQHSCES